MKQSQVSEAEFVIRQLYGITSDYGMGFAAQLRSLLQLGLRRLGLQLGIVSRIDGKDYHVVESAGPIERPGPGEKFDLSDTFCEFTIRADGPIGFYHAGEQVQDHPCYTKFGLESYLGVPIKNRTGVFGTLNFSSPEKRGRPFADVDRDVVQLMATWIGGELERRELEKNLDLVHGLIPICASCKQIRSAMSGWQRLEQYFADHGDLAFTHGICPTCAESEMNRLKG